MSNDYESTITKKHDPKETWPDITDYKAAAITIRDISTRPDLSSGAKMLALALSSHYPHNAASRAFESFDVSASIETIRTHCGVKSCTTIHSARRELRAKGLLTYTTGNRTDRYKLLWLSDEKVRTLGGTL